ncbi:MAG: NADPH-dependent 7-cyano-7-deazaguanine reductase QueF [Bdellovibrionia bacterium]
MKKTTNELLDHAPLGKKSSYRDTYDPSLLFALPRKLKRDEIQVPSNLPFQGFDYWTAFELSWLNLKGRPEVALAHFQIPCESPCLIESKSFKLYLNSFNNSRFSSFEQVQDKLINDLSHATQSSVHVNVQPLKEARFPIGSLSGTSLDDLDIECTTYLPEPSYLKTLGQDTVDETLHSHLLKSNCLVTGQPDWGSLQIHYRGKKIEPQGLLRYIVSLRNHNEFHEQCVERIFMDILRTCEPQALSVYARYTRRGGLDINPFRTNEDRAPQLDRLIRQ